MSDKTYLYDVKRQEYPIYEIETVKAEEHYWDFKVFEITSWDPTKSDNPIDNIIDKESIIGGFIKWDGCSHFYFGEEDEKGNRDSYLHICSSHNFKRIAKLLEYLYKIAPLKMGRGEDGLDEEWGEDLEMGIMT